MTTKTTPFTLDEAKRIHEMPRILATVRELVAQQVLVEHLESECKRVAAEVAKRVREACAQPFDIVHVSGTRTRTKISESIRALDLDAIVRDVLEGR